MSQTYEGRLARSDAPLHGMQAAAVLQHSFVEIGYEIISTAILPLLLIQIGQLLVTGQRMCTKYWLTL